MKIGAPSPLISSTPRAPQSAAPPRTGDIVEIVGGGGGALVGSIAGSYAGAFGGAALGAVLGLGIGPAWGAMTSSGPTEFLTHSLFGLGMSTRAGIIIGGATGLVGGATLGWRAAGKLGQALGHAPQGRKADTRIFTGPIATTLVTGGLLSGLAGGFAAGAAVAATHNLLAGNALGAGAIAAGVGGAVALGATGLLGASQILKGTRWTGQQIKAGVEKLQPTLKKIQASPYHRVAYGAAGGALLVGALGASTGMGVGVAIGSVIMGAGMGAAGGFISKPPL